MRDSEVRSLLLQVFILCGDGYKLVLVCGVKIIPWLRVIGLVPAKHTSRHELGNFWGFLLFFGGESENTQRSRTDLACGHLFISDLIPLRAVLFHLCFDRLQYKIKQDKGQPKVEVQI